MSQQIIIIVSGVFGLVVLFFVGRFIIVFMFPETYEKTQRNHTLKNIEQYFGFLLEKGYNIRETKYGYKYVELVSKDCVISIIQDRGEVLVSFSPAFGSDDFTNRIGLEAMIYYLSQGQNYISCAERTRVKSEKGQFERLAGLLKEHIDQIVPYFGNDYSEHKYELKKVEKKYFDCMVAEIGQQKKKINRA